MATTTKTKTASLKDLVNVAKKQESKDSKPVRPTIELTPEGQEIMRRWVVANVVAKEFSSHEKNVIEEAKSHCLDEYIDSVWALKGHPKNPKFVLNKNGSPDMQGNFQVQSRFSFNIPQHGDDQTTEDALIIKLVEAGWTEEDATALVKEELQLDDEVGIRNFNDLMTGHKEATTWVDASDQEQELGQRLMDYIVSDAFTDEERQVILSSKDKCKVRDGEGFLHRIAHRAKTKQQLEAFLKHFVTPVHFPSHAKFAINDTSEARNRRMVNEAAGILGVDLED